ncbi:hypothetical protein L7F22_023486 [Adiantum nelumboides]|nr:hypothetical protein [Adiantum nelumboides]
MGAVLLQQDPHNTRMWPVYFPSRFMNALEKDYTKAKFMMLALIFAVRKSRSYLLLKTFVIIIAKNIFPWVSSQMMLSSRISKWIMEFQEFQYSFKVEDSVRAQLAGILTYKVHERDTKVPEVKILLLPPPKSIPNAFTLLFDGEFRKAIGKLGGGPVILDPNGEVVTKEHVKLPSSTSNNEAEYGILLYGLHMCLAQKIQCLMVKGDALLIVKQILGIWACKNERLRQKVHAINQFEEVQLYYIPRKQNEDVDLLAQKAVACVGKEVQFIMAAAVIKQPKYQGIESLSPIVSYILEGEFPPGFTKTQKQRLIKKASSYLFLEGSLYQRGKDQVCRRISITKEIPAILEEKANGIIAGIISKMVKDKTKLWDDFLDGAFWAYRTTYKEAIEFTPFYLFYDQEALQPIELNIPTM